MLATPHARLPLQTSSPARRYPTCHVVREPACPWKALRLGARSVAHDGDDGAHDVDDGADGRMTVQMMVQMDNGSLPSLSLAVCRLREFGFRHAN